MPKKKRLEGLEVYEVSLVPRGANKKKFYLYKSENTQEEEMEEILKAILNGDVENEEEIQKQFDAIFDKAEIEKAEDKEQMMAALKGAMKLLQTVKGKMPEKAYEDMMKKMSKLAGFGPRRDGSGSNGQGLGPGKGKADGSGMEDDKEEKAKADKACGKKKTKKEEDGVENKKNTDPKVEEKLDELFKQTEKLQKENDELRDKYTQEVEARVQKEFQEKAAGYDHLGVGQDDLAAVLKSANEKLDEETYKKLEGVLKSADEKLSKSELLKEKGSNLGDDESSAYSQIKKIALKKQEENKDLTAEAAFAEALEENPELYQKYEEEGSN